METNSLIIITLALFNLIALGFVFALWRRGRTGASDRPLEDSLQLIKAELKGAQNDSLESIRESIDRAHTLLNSRLAEGTSSIDRRMEVISEIQSTLGQLTIQAKNMEKVGRNIQTLSELLRPPKVRGSLGETLLENLLSEILPRQLIELQYRFSNHQKVDAAIRVGEQLLPIDAKFPLESFERLTAEPDNQALKKDFFQTLKKHIDDIAAKYIRPTEHTTEFALIYLPAERIYYEIISGDDQTIFSYALQKRVIPTSPAHLYPLLATITAVYSDIKLSTRSLTEGAHRLTSGLAALKEGVERQRGYLTKMQSSLKSAGANLDRALIETDSMDAGLNRITDPDSELIETIEN